VARFTTAGALDTTYNTTGTKLITNVGDFSGTGSSGDIAAGVLIDTANSNKIVLAGQGQVAKGGGNSNINFGVSRDASNGSGTPSSSTIAFPANNDDVGTCVAIDSSNRVVMGGYSGSAPKFGVVRLQDNSNTKDTNFNGGAAYSFSIGNAGTKDDRAYAIAVDSSNRIFLAGKAKNSNNLYDFAIARVTAAGALDTTFNSTGHKTITVTASVDNIAKAIKIDSSGKVVMAGITTLSGNTAIAITRIWP
ncbi:MAG: delta-60 repeat domain-containing protein, partial [Deltaproteobacteria bacterium]